MTINSLKLKVWNSPTITTWMSYSTKALSLFVVLPLILRKFSAGDVVLWYLFSTIISLQSIADFGFRQTFVRIIAFAFGGAGDIGMFGNKKEENNINDGNPNIPLLQKIMSTMQYIYIALTVIVFTLMITLGTWSMVKPIANASNISQAWISWGIVIFVSCISFYGKVYLNYIEGLFKIVIARRLEILTSLGSIITSICVMAINPSILNLIIANQVWAIIVVIRNWAICQTIEDSFYKKISITLPFDKYVFQKIWKPAWKSGISGFMSVGLTNLTGLTYAQVGNSEIVASYLLAIRIINQIKEVSMAPFYSKIPLIARFRVNNELDNLLTTIKKGMFLSHLVFVIGFVSVGIFSDKILMLIKSDIQFVDHKMWLLIGIAYFIHRYGAMHIQVYLSTNHVISHIADGISGLIYIVSCTLLIQYIGAYAIPVGMIIGYLGFYSWYAAKYSYSSIGTNFWVFEKKTSLLPVSICLVYITYDFFIKTLF